MLKEELENEQHRQENKYRIIEIATHPKFIKMKEAFENVFRKNDLFPNTKFDKNVWFLQNDEKFQTMIKPTSGSTPGQIGNSKMLNLLSELSSGGSDMKKLSVEVSKFIDRICEILLKAQIMINRSSEQIKEYNAYENRTVLEIKCNELTKKVREPNYSILKVKIARLDYFPEGNYSFNFHFLETDPNIINSTKSVNNKLVNNKNIKITKSGHMLIFNNDPQNDTLFQPIEFHAVELNDNNRSFHDFAYSGSNLSSFQLHIYRDDLLFAESSFENFLEMFIVNLNFLKDINSSTNSFNWKLTCNFNHELLKQLKVPINHIVDYYDVFLEFSFDFDPFTLATIFYRVLRIFRDVIETKSENQVIIEEILDYFKPMKETIKYILEKSDEQEPDSKCCNTCLIF